MICSAKPKHFNDINELQKAYGLRSIEPLSINHRDISLVALDVQGRVVGFIWMGLMAGNTRGYIDHFVVLPDYAKQGVGFQLGKALYDRAFKRGVREVFGVIRHNEFHDKSAMNALKFGLVAHSEPYTYVCGEANYIKSQLGAVYGW